MYVRKGWVFLFLVLMIAFCATALYGMWAFWPSENPNGKGLLARKTVHYFGWDRLLSRESLFFVMVAFAGALGGMVHAVRSVVVYIGSRKLMWSWTPFYILKPVLGAMLATLLYVVLRAGLFSPSASTEQASPYGFAAIAALAGLFSNEAAEKLQSIAEQMFQKTTVRKDHFTEGPGALTGDATPTSTDVTLTGKVNPMGQETTYFFEYGATATYGSETVRQNAGDGTDDVEVQAVITGLAPGTAWHYRLVATSEAGTTKGDDRQFATLTI